MEDDNPERDGVATTRLHPLGALRGIAVSSGVALGPAVVFNRNAISFPRMAMAAHEAPHEKLRLHEAILRSRARMERVRDALSDAEAEHRLILEAHLLMHRDELLVGATERAIDQGKNAEWALEFAMGELSAKLSQAKEPYLRERARDFDQVKEEILRELTGASLALPTLDAPSVLIAVDLSPAEFLSLPREKVLAIVTELGTSTGHTAILARALRIPAIVNVSRATRRIEKGAVVIVDARRGEVFLNPSEVERTRAEGRADRYRTFTGRLRDDAPEHTTLRDGTKVEIHANLELEVEVQEALLARAEGVGLYRTEFLYLDGALPSEEHLEAVFTRVGQAFAPHPVTVRTFDLGADKLPLGAPEPGINPALGLRGLRLALARPQLFEAQLRAILRASKSTSLRVMFPMVTSVEEMREAKRSVQRVRLQLERAGVQVGEVALGAMIEVPAAAMMTRALASECDFFSIGTNDLAQYAMAADRNNPVVAQLASCLSPGLIHLLAHIAEGARPTAIPTSICGDMAADPLALPLLLGMGFHSLSMSPSEIPLARAIAARLEKTVLEKLAQDALACVTTREVERTIVRAVGAVLGDLWDEHGLVLNSH